MCQLMWHADGLLATALVCCGPPLLAAEPVSESLAPCRCRKAWPAASSLLPSLTASDYVRLMRWAPALPQWPPLAVDPLQSTQRQLQETLPVKTLHRAHSFKKRMGLFPTLARRVVKLTIAALSTGSLSTVPVYGTSPCQ
jgi:hypothetical protein